MKDWVELYNRVEILTEKIPSTTLQRANTADIIVSSTLPRCVQSAQALNPAKSFLIEDIFDEAALPHGHWPMPKLPLAVWGVLFRLAWFGGYSANTETFSQATARAQRAALRLVMLAQEYGTVFLVGHGIMTILIAKHLLVMGWSGPKRPMSKYWQCSVYHAPSGD